MAHLVRLTTARNHREESISHHHQFQAFGNKVNKDVDPYIQFSNVFKKKYHPRRIGKSVKCRNLRNVEQKKIKIAFIKSTTLSNNEIDASYEFKA